MRCVRRRRNAAATNTGRVIAATAGRRYGGRNVRSLGRGRAQSGCWPSWAFHAHSVIFMSVNTALKLESSGLQA